MEVRRFLRLLSNRKWILIGVPLLVIVITYIYVLSMPDTFISHSRMSTGLVDKSQQVITTDGFQESKINSDFSNLMEMMRLNKVFDQVSYRLILHDLTDTVPFRPKTKLINQLNESAIKHAIEVYRKHYIARESLNVYNSDEKGLLSLIKSLDYNYEALQKKVVIYRPNNSDFIDVTFESENPNLSAFVANTLMEEFILYYSEYLKNNQQKTVNFLDNELHKKETEMNRLKDLLKNYKIQNRVLNLNEQAKSLYSQIANFETLKQLAEKDVAAYTGALRNIEDKFNPNERKYFEATLVPINQQIANTKQTLLNLSDEYIKSNYDDKIKRKLDSVKNVVTYQIQQATDKYIVNPLAAKESLILQKVKLELDNDLAKFSLTTLSDELVRLNKKFDLLVPHEAVIQNYESAIDVASKEYLDAQFRYNKSSLESSLAISLRQVEFGLPGPASPTKKAILVVLSGLISFTLVLITLFIVFYLDDSVAASTELADKTNQVVLGYLPLLTSSVIQLKTLWEKPFDKDLRLQNFKEMLRSCRFEIETEMGKSKMLMVNSLCTGEGKSLFLMSLAYAFLMTRKRVLIIDGNFTNPTITSATGTELFLEDYLLGVSSLPSFRPITEIMVMGNRGGDTSLLEISNPENIEMKLAQLKESFDIILIETEGLSSFNKSKEWVVFTDKVVTVFEAGRKINYKKSQSILYLNSIEGKFIGWVMNRDENEMIEKPNKVKQSQSIFSKNIELQWA